MARSRCHFLPPYLLARIAANRPERAELWRTCLRHDAELRARRDTRLEERSGPLTTDPDWVVHSADNTATLPGRVVRSAGEPASGDPAVDEAADGIVGSLAMFEEVYQRDSYDAAGATVSATVHYEQDYANAFWDGTQLVFGDGDGEIVARLTRAVDVVGHELAHAVIEHTAGLAYFGQAGALNESVSDVFAACLEQRLLGQTATEADWLIGSELFLPGVNARGLRDMANPGTAYDDPSLGKDPQPAHMDDYVTTTDDNGGVHINSGIPNRAFHLAATGIGRLEGAGSSAEGAGRIWYDALIGGEVGPLTGFAGFAAATLAMAGEHTDTVSRAWQAVGVDPSGVAGAPGDEPVPAEPPVASRTVTVRRSGGVMGRTVDASVDLDSGDERAPEVAALTERIDLNDIVDLPPQPDRYVYDFDLCGRRKEQVPEQCLTEDLSALVRLILR